MPANLCRGVEQRVRPSGRRAATAASFRGFRYAHAIFQFLIRELSGGVATSQRLQFCIRTLCSETGGSGATNHFSTTDCRCRRRARASKGQYSANDARRASQYRKTRAGSGETAQTDDERIQHACRSICDSVQKLS